MMNEKEFRCESLTDEETFHRKVPDFRNPKFQRD